MSEYWRDWLLPTGRRMFLVHGGSTLSTKDTDRYLGICGPAWFSVHLHEGQRWLCFVVAASMESKAKVEMPRTAEETLAWMQMVVEMSGIKQEKWK